MNKKTFTIELDKKIYGLDEIIKAHHYISDLAMMNIQEHGDFFHCKFEITAINSDIDNFIKKFYYQLSREQVKKMFAKENKNIRDLIVQQAFKPIANLMQAIDEL